MKLKKIQYKKKNKKITFRNKIINLYKIKKISLTILQVLSKLWLPQNFNMRYNNISGYSM